MIIECFKCKKKFDVLDSLIPIEGRKIQCGSCNNIWFFKHNDNFIHEEVKTDKKSEIIENLEKIEETNIDYNKQNFIEEDESKNVKLNKTFNYGLVNILSLLIVGIISFVALIIVLDTFKSPLSTTFPGLELILYNLFETIKDIFLFNKNLFL